MTENLHEHRNILVFIGKNICEAGDIIVVPFLEAEAINVKGIAMVFVNTILHFCYVKEIELGAEGDRVIEDGSLVLHQEDIELPAKAGAIDIGRSHHLETGVCQLEVGTHGIVVLAEVGQKRHIAMAMGGHLITNFQKRDVRISAQQSIFQRKTEGIV